MRIFFSGELLWPWMSGWQRCQVLRDLGHEVIPFEQGVFLHRATLRRPERLITGKFHRTGVVEHFNRSLPKAVASAKPQLAWLEWPMLLTRETLAEAQKQLPGCTFVSFQDDNPFGSRPG